MNATVQQAYEQLPPEIQAAVDQLILSVSQQPASPLAKPRPFADLPGAGSMPGIWMADDFDETPENFNGYM